MEQHTERKKVTIKGVDNDAWELLRRIREAEQRMLGAILSECIYEHWERHYEASDSLSDE